MDSVTTQRDRMAWYDPAPGPAFEAIERAIDRMAAKPDVFEGLFANNGFIGVDWKRAGYCHHSNELLVALFGGMIDMASARGALYDELRLANAVGKVTVMDGSQYWVLLAAAGIEEPPDWMELAYRDEPATVPRNRLAFAQAVNELIDAEELGGYFERGPGASVDHNTIRPLGMAAYEEAVSERYRAPEDEPERPLPPDPWEVVKAKANAEHLPPDKRIALLIVLALYNDLHAREYLNKGRGWTFHGTELGGWMKERFDSNERAARAALRALATYPGW